MKTIALALLSLVAGILALSNVEAADSIDSLIAQNRLQVSSQLVPKGLRVPGQKLGLNITLATDRWFSGGTKILIPEVNELVILQSSQFATNSSEQRDGNSWVLQTWTLDLYPQRAGQFQLPAIAIEVNVSSGISSEVSGVLRTQPSTFTVTIPPALSDLQRWVAAPQFSVQQDINKSLDELAVGDAFERSIEFRAKDLQAMMLPTAQLDVIDGLAVYPKPPVLETQNNRGSIIALRRDRSTYVIEQPGKYHFAEQRYAWWNSELQELQTLVVEAVEFTVAGEVTTTATAATALERDKLLPMLLAATACTGVLLALWLLWRARHLLPLKAMQRYWHKAWHVLRSLGRPALARRLNPDSSAGD